MATKQQASKVIVAKIDRDYLWKEGDDLPSRKGTTWSAIPGFEYDNTWVLHQVAEDGGAPAVRFRVLDDDGEVYYGGELYNDSECINQQVVLKWCERDAGATEIQVKINDEWITEIG